MRLQLLSDLHLEANPGFVAEPAPGASLLVLAGATALCFVLALRGYDPQRGWMRRGN